MYIYLIRHANSLPRDGMSYEDAGKVSLSPEGKKQLKSLKRNIFRYKFEAIFSSPLQRTKETAESVKSKYKLPVFFDEKLKEHVVSLSATRKEYKEIKNRTRSEPAWKPSDGESLVECASRLNEFIEEISKNSLNSVAIISHELIISAFLRIYCGASGIPKIEEASITKIEYTGGKFRLIFISKVNFFEKARRKIVYIIKGN